MSASRSRAIESRRVAVRRPSADGAAGSRAESGVPGTGEALPRSKVGSRWRVATLSLVYLLTVAHFVHWKLAGKTLAPLELNEVMYTLELGIVTAGFLFMVAAFVASAIFGRFFCSWVCHILALQDSCAWLLGKIGIRPRPIRSRALLLVPVGALLYMFAWPQVLRMLDGQPMPKWRILGDDAGWASFVTRDFARNLPGPTIAILTFLVCGFCIVYVLGSRSFCAYGCPYGAVFSLADRVAPGRIVSRGDCTSCGRCTANCQSHVRVHEELQAFGKVVSPTCLKDLDCVRACPRGNIHFGFTRPSFFASWRKHDRVHRTYDFTLVEDVLVVVVFLATLVVFRGLYDAVPFLMTLGLGAIFGFLAVVSWRLLRERHVRSFALDLKQAGRLTKSGVGFASIAGVLALFSVHSGWIRYHEDSARRALGACEGDVHAGRSPDPIALDRATASLETCARWGLVRPPRLERDLGSIALLRREPESAEGHLRQALASLPNDLDLRMRLARALMDQGRRDAAAGELRTTIELASDSARDRADHAQVRAAAHQLLGNLSAEGGDRAGAISEFEAAIRDDPLGSAPRVDLGMLLADDGRLEDALAQFREAVRLRPESSLARYDLACCLSASGDEASAASEYREVIARDPKNVDAHNNLGLLMANHGDLDAAVREFELAIAIQPEFAHSHFNLARILAARGQREEAERHLGIAAKSNPEYAHLLEGASEGREGKR
ncbi:MAG: tetratricopeptide repeat protein [Planctomycetes bacterium]|nr:tetratricopeptide repeat protein [Planctomycetota bacterium]MBI3845490.1 tetratricopeptide repeat protein [Planctomycetota bacterium]